MKNTFSEIVWGTFFLKTLSRLKNYVLRPTESDSSSKTIHVVFFPGLNSQIQVKIPKLIV